MWMRLSNEYWWRRLLKDSSGNRKEDTGECDSTEFHDTTLFLPGGIHRIIWERSTLLLFAVNADWHIQGVLFYFISSRFPFCLSHRCILLSGNTNTAYKSGAPRLSTAKRCDRSLTALRGFFCTTLNGGWTQQQAQRILHSDQNLSSLLALWSRSNGARSRENKDYKR